jgi:hypothetical protein
MNQKQEDKMRSIYRRATPKIYGRKYYYVLGFTKVKGRKVFWGPFLESDEAYKWLAQLNDGEQFELITRDPHRAVRLVRDMLIKRGESPDEALKRLIHKKPGDGNQVTEGEKPQSFISRLMQGRLTPKSRSLAYDIPLPQRPKLSIQQEE